jgi:hypothetical protein
MTYIGAAAFYGCTGLTSITVPDLVTYIGSSAFGSCNSLTAINIDVNNRYYSSIDGVFYDKLQSELIQYPTSKTGNHYTIPNSVKSIGGFAFEDCINLTSVTIPNSVMSINNCAFVHCTGLASITIPNSVTSIRTDVFYNCSSLEVIDVHENNTTYASENGVLFNKAKTSLIKYPEGKPDENYTISNMVERIGVNAFYRCKHRISISIPNSVESIGYSAFLGCIGLTSVTKLNPTPQTIDPSVFEEVTIGNISLYVPAESVNLYKAAPIWQDFKTITAYTPSTINTPASANAISIYPDPATESFRIAGITVPTQASVTDINGRSVFKKIISGDESIIARLWPKGIYLVRVNMETVKVIKN